MTIPDIVIITGLLFTTWSATCVVAWGVGRVQGYDKGFAFGHNAGYSLAWSVVTNSLNRDMSLGSYTGQDVDPWTYLDEELPINSHLEREVAKRPRAEAHMSGSGAQSNVLFFNNTKEDRD